MIWGYTHFRYSRKRTIGQWGGWHPLPFVVTLVVSNPSGLFLLVNINDIPILIQWFYNVLYPTVILHSEIVVAHHPISSPEYPSFLCPNVSLWLHLHIHVPVLRPLLHFASLFVFDLDGFGYNCVADRDAVLYGITASFFWVVPLCFVILGLVTNLTPLLKRRGLAWQGLKTVNCIGHFFQVASTTMASVGLLPFMCYDHPNGNLVVIVMLNFYVRDRKGLILSRSF